MLSSALINAFLAPGFSNALALLAMVVIVAGHFIWFLERIDNPDVSDRVCVNLSE